MSYKRVDRNQSDIVKALRQYGCTVQSLAALGHGVPDLLVARSGANYLLEVKDGSLPPSRQKRTPDEIAWDIKWAAKVHLVTSVDEALEAVGITV